MRWVVSPHQPFAHNEKAPTEVRALGLVQVAGADLRRTRGVLIYRACVFVIAVHSASALTARISLRIHLLRSEQDSNLHLPSAW